MMEKIKYEHIVDCIGKAICFDLQATYSKEEVKQLLDYTFACVEPAIQKKINRLQSKLDKIEAYCEDINKDELAIYVEKGIADDILEII